MTEQLSSLTVQSAPSAGGIGTREDADSLRREILGDDVLLRIDQVAFLVGCSQRQIYAMIHRGRFPGPRKLGVLSRWRLGLLKQWLHADELRRC